MSSRIGRFVAKKQKERNEFKKAYARSVEKVKADTKARASRQRKSAAYAKAKKKYGNTPKERRAKMVKNLKEAGKSFESFGGSGGGTMPAFNMGYGAPPRKRTVKRKPKNQYAVVGGYAYPVKTVKKKKTAKKKRSKDPFTDFF